MKTLLKNATIIPMTNEEYFFQGDILIEDEKLSFVGLNYDGPYDVLKDASSFIALPGFVNAHTHLAMTLMRNYKDSQENLQAWLSEIFPIEDKLNEDDIYYGSLNGIAELIKSGTTTFADMYFQQWKTVEAVIESGIRACIGITFFGDIDETNRRIENNYSKILNAADNNPLITVHAAPHAIYTCTKETYERVTQFCLENKTYMNTHLSETKKEVDDCINQTGLRPVEYLDSINAFTSPTYLAHGIYFDDNELEILKKRNVSVVHNPSSNCKLASGICPIGHYREMGINVALGTDGASSNNNLSMIKEMRLAAMISTVSTMKPAATTPYQILKMATINGAKALGLDNKIGTLEVGKEADIVLINKNISEMTPLNNIFSALVFSLPDRAIDSVYCRGKEIMRKGKLLTIDEDDVIKNVNRQWEDILRR